MVAFSMVDFPVLAEHQLIDSQIQRPRIVVRLLVWMLLCVVPSEPSPLGPGGTAPLFLVVERQCAEKASVLVCHGNICRRSS